MEQYGIRRTELHLAQLGQRVMTDEARINWLFQELEKVKEKIGMETEHSKMEKAMKEVEKQPKEQPQQSRRRRIVN